jgi:hypothetical protein
VGLNVGDSGRFGPFDPLFIDNTPAHTRDFIKLHALFQAKLFRLLAFDKDGPEQASLRGFDPLPGEGFLDIAAGPEDSEKDDQPRYLFLDSDFF